MVSPVAILFLLKNAPNCTSEHPYFQKFSGGGHPPDPPRERRLRGKPLHGRWASPTKKNYPQRFSGSAPGMSTLWMVLWVLSASRYFAHNDASVPQKQNFVSFWRQSVWVVWRNVRVRTNTPYAKRSATQVILEIACRVQHSLTNSVATNHKSTKKRNRGAGTTIRLQLQQ